MSWFVSRARARRQRRSAPFISSWLPQRPKRCPELGGEALWLFPGRKVPAFVELVVMDELGIRSLCPAPRHSIDLIREHAHGNRDRNVLRGKKGQLVLPVQTNRRNSRGRQPIEGDVVEDVVSRQALGLTIKDAFNEFVAAYVMVKYPGG
jgi:hypothetical protein